MRLLSNTLESIQCLLWMWIWLQRIKIMKCRLQQDGTTNLLTAIEHYLFMIVSICRLFAYDEFNARFLKWRLEFDWLRVENYRKTAARASYSVTYRIAYSCIYYAIWSSVLIPIHNRNRWLSGYFRWYTIALANTYPNSVDLQPCGIFLAEINSLKCILHHSINLLWQSVYEFNNVFQPAKEQC